MTSLIDCDACGRRISRAAEACPQCGHPNRETTSRTATDSSCYACPSPATTRCQNCNELSCVRHVQRILIRNGKGGVNEVRCKKCYASAEASNALFWIVLVVALIAMAVVFSVFALPDLQSKGLLPR